MVLRKAFWGGPYPSGGGGGGGGGGTTFPIFAFALANADPVAMLLNGTWIPATDPVASTITVFDMLGS